MRNVEPTTCSRDKGKLLALGTEVDEFILLQSLHLEWHGSNEYRDHDWKNDSTQTMLIRESIAIQSKNRLSFEGAITKIAEPVAFVYVGVGVLSKKCWQ